MKIISAGLNSIKNLHHLSEMNKIDNCGSVEATGFKILRKIKHKKCPKIILKKAMKIKIGLNMRLKWPYLSQTGSKRQRQMKN